MTYRIRLRPEGYRLCVLFLKLFERVYAPLTAGLLRPVAADAALGEEKRHQLDRLYERIMTDLDALGERLLDANRTIGQPTKLATICCCAPKPRRTMSETSVSRRPLKRCPSCAGR